MLHAEIGSAAKALIEDQGDALRLEQLAATVQFAVERNLKPRAIGKSVFLLKRAAALLRMYAPNLPVALRKATMKLLAGPLTDLARREAVDRKSTLVGEFEAAELIGMTVSDLRLICCDPSVRRQLGWPRPIGTRLLFDRRALDGLDGARFISTLSASDPWPTQSWPKGWR